MPSLIIARCKLNLSFISQAVSYNDVVKNRSLAVAAI